jgi:hypothetical protein
MPFWKLGADMEPLPLGSGLNECLEQGSEVESVTHAVGAVLAVSDVSMLFPLRTCTSMS